VAQRGGRPAAPHAGGGGAAGGVGGMLRKLLHFYRTVV
jgi:hypothetical protein